MSLSKSVNVSHAQLAVICNVCEEATVPGKNYCIECKQTLCPTCEKFHRKVASTKDHNVVLRSQIGDLDTTILTCTDHGDKASFHCEKCNKPVCDKCVTGKHQGHKMVDLTEIFEKEKTLLQNDIKKLQREVLPKLMEKETDITKAKIEYDEKLKKIKKNIEDENQALQRKLERINNERLETLASIREYSVSTFDGCKAEIKTKIKLIEERISEYKDALRKNSLPVLIDIAKTKKPLPELECTKELPEVPSFVSGNIQKAVGYLGKLHASFPHLLAMPLEQTIPTILSKFICPLKGCPSICINKEGDVWLGGGESRELAMVDIKGQVIRKKKILNRPEALAVMDCGDIIVSPRHEDSRSVSRILTYGSEQHVFDSSPFFSYGVSVTADQRILICTGDGKVVTIRGGTVEHIYQGAGVNSALHAVEAPNGNIYIGDWAVPAVVITSKNGAILKTMATCGRKLGKPEGLVVDKMGNVLCADSNNHCVYIIDRNQEISELVTYSHGPRWLAVDIDNNLWITQLNGTVLVVKYLA